MTGTVIPVLLALFLPALTGRVLGVLSWRVAGVSFGFGGRAAVQSWCAAGMLAGCTVRGDALGAVAAVLAGIVPWVQWVPWWQRRRCARRLAVIGAGEETT